MMGDMTNDKALIELTVRYGRFGERVKRLALQIDEHMARELIGGVEVSDDAFTKMMLVDYPTGVIKTRERAFRMRREFAEKVADLMVPALMEAFGVNDTFDGYRIEDMSQEERDYHRAARRI